MPFKKLDADQARKGMSRVLLIGGPNTWKTSSIVRTWFQPIHIMSYPGEKGSASIPSGVEGVNGYVWEEPEDPTKVKISDVIREIETTTWDILMGKHGPITTFAGDGFHKLASYYWRREYLRLLDVYQEQINTGKMTEEDCKLKAYGNENFGARREIMAYVTKVLQSNVPHVVFTCWEGREADEQGSKSSHIFADLPGKLATHMTGEFTVVLQSEVSLPDPQGKRKGRWLTRPKGKVWGVGVKGPVEIISKIPDEVPMDWQKLYPQLLGEAPVAATPTAPKPTAPKPN